MRWTIPVIVTIFSAAAAVFPAGAQVNGSWQPLAQLESGTAVAVRTTQPIDVKAADGRVFTGVIDEDVLDRNGRMAIPRGSTAELMVRKSADSSLVVDLDSVTVNGQRYAVLANPATVGTSGTVNNGVDTLGANQTTAEFVGGGALLGTLIGAIAGGGKGAAIGAAAGAAAGAGTQIVTQGQSVTVPAESVLTFRLQRPLTLGVQDTGYTRDGWHYHRD
jgi:hypothetical protein